MILRYMSPVQCSIFSICHLLVRSPPHQSFLPLLVYAHFLPIPLLVLRLYQHSSDTSPASYLSPSPPSSSTTPSVPNSTWCRLAQLPPVLELLSRSSDRVACLGEIGLDFSPHVIPKGDARLVREGPRGVTCYMQYGCCLPGWQLGCLPACLVACLAGWLANLLASCLTTTTNPSVCCCAR